MAPEQHRGNIVVERETDLHERFIRLLLIGELGVLSKEERLALEAHAIECDACFEAMGRGAAAAAVMRAQSERFLSILQDEESTEQASRSTDRFSRWFARILRPRFAVPTFAAALLLAVILWPRGSSDLRDLATFPRPESSSLALRGPASRDTRRELLDMGLGNFDLGKYEAAERSFRTMLEKDPDDPEAAYLLGLTLAWRGQPEAAQLPLERARQLATDELRPHAEWALANAYLGAGQHAQAKKLLEEIETKRGEYALRAGQLLQRFK